MHASAKTVSQDPILRYGGVYTLALAYAGTSNNDTVWGLLHIAVSDTSDDVRRAAVTLLAFLLFKNPGQVPRIVQLLSEATIHMYDAEPPLHWVSLVRELVFKMLLRSWSL